MPAQDHPADKLDLSPKRRKRPRREPKTSNNVDGIVRQLDSLAERLAHDDPEDYRHVYRLREALERVERVAVRGWRKSGFTDAEIGEALGGVTKQAIQQRFPRSRLHLLSDEDGWPR